MKEITVITNLQITKIYKDVSECFELDKNSYAEGQKLIVENAMDADDVIVTNVQEFELETEDKPVEKMTYEKYVDIVEKMKKSQDFTIDVRDYSVKELMVIHNFIMYDEVYEICKKFKHMDVRRMLKVIEMAAED